MQPPNAIADGLLIFCVGYGRKLSASGRLQGRFDELAVGLRKIVHDPKLSPGPRGVNEPARGFPLRAVLLSYPRPTPE